MTFTHGGYRRILKTLLKPSTLGDEKPQQCELGKAQWNEPAVLKGMRQYAQKYELEKCYGRATALRGTYEL